MTIAEVIQSEEKRGTEELYIKKIILLFRFLLNSIFT